MAGGEAFWQSDGGGGASSLDDLTDVTVAAPADGDALVYDSGTGVWGAEAVSGSGATWDLVVDESGASIANWTTVSGTWAANAGGYLEQTSTVAAYRGLVLTAHVAPGAGLTMQAEVRFPSGSAALRRLMLSPASNGLTGATHDPWGGIQISTSGLIIQRGDQEAVSEGRTVSADTWYTVRTVLLGQILTVYVDGVFAGARRVISTAGLTQAARILLVNYTGPGHYRNIKVWRLAGPA